MRDDIQGLRGISIIFVLLFHIWPSYFPNGYLGVDIFFVISGYLMSFLFARESKLTVKTIGNFYFRRIKRIFPLYYLIIPFILITSQFTLGQVWLFLNNRHVVYSLFFLKNMETIWDERDYFNSFKSIGTSKDVYLHTWSLAVEVQFYLFVPVIFLILEKLKKKTWKILFLTFLTITTSVSFTVTPPTFAFNYPLSRLWQFSLGILAQHFHDEHDEILASELAPTKPFVNTRRIISLFLLTILLTVLLPLEIDTTVLRPIMTLISAAILWINGGVLEKNVLSNRPLTYIGDISYVLYLVHWPVIVFVGTSTALQIQNTLVVSFLLSIFLHHFFEIPFRKFSPRNIVSLLCILFTINAGATVLVKTCPGFQSFVRDWELSKVNTTIQETIKKNIEYANTPVSSILKCDFIESQGYARELHRPWGLCEYPKGNGSNTILLLGNSYAMNQANMINEEFHGNYSRFLILSSIGFQVIYDGFTNSTDPFFHDQWRHMMNITETLKPDFIFVITRQMDKQKTPIFMNITEDPVVLQYTEKIKKLESISKRVFIHGVHPLYQLLHLNNYVEALKNNSQLLPFNLKKDAADAEMQWARTRLEAINCTKCEAMDTSTPFLDGDYYLTYDPETLLSFADNDIHLTEAGVDRLRPMYRNIISRL